MSKSTERPVCPCAIRYRKRAFVSAPVPKPAICRIVQSRPRYIVGYGPRVNGGGPGRPVSSPGGARPPPPGETRRGGGAPAARPGLWGVEAGVVGPARLLDLPGGELPLRPKLKAGPDAEPGAEP